ncbi:MAG: glycosyltransferase [Bacteriovoracaceae bacterium]|nr:glycosyltransferase [Bacteriovoracaceae bacterium]
MREKVVINDLAALYVCLSSDWGSIERRFIQDAIYLRDVGGSPLLLCFKGTHLLKAAKVNDLRYIEIELQEISLFNFSFHFFLKKIIKENAIDIVHCYGFNFVAMTCMVMGRYKQIPLFVTLNKPVEQYFKNYFYKYLFKRIDAIITLDAFSRELVSSFLPLSQKRMHSFGMGLELYQVHPPSTAARSVVKIGCYVPQTVSDKAYFIPLFNAIRILLTEEGPKRILEKMEIFLFTDINWAVSHINNELRWLIKDFGLEDYIRLDNGLKLLGSRPQFDILLGLESNEIIYDYEIWSLMHNIPILVPRTSAREHLLSQNEFMGESYMANDARELKNKLGKIIGRLTKYHEDLRACSGAIREEHSLERYSENIFALYEKAKQQRKRLFNPEKTA